MVRAGKSGFSLIELMIVVAVIGVLAAIGYPSYQEHVRKTQRAEVTSRLLENAQLLERHFTRHGSYDAGTVAGLIARSPATGPALFDITLVRAADSYTLTATAVGGGMMAGDSCAVYTLNQLGQRMPAEAKCWRR